MWKNPIQTLKEKTKQPNPPHKTKTCSFILWGWSNTETDDTKRFWSLHSWKYSKLSETQSRVTCFNWSCSEKRDWSWYFSKVSSNLNHPVWFYVLASFYTILAYKFWPLLEMTHHVGSIFNRPIYSCSEMKLILFSLESMYH